MNENSFRMTPYDDAYPTCERTYAELRIYPGELDPKLVTQRLGISPTSILSKKDQRNTALDKKHTVQLNGWFLSSEDNIISKDLRRHLDFLLDELEPKAPQLRKLQEMSGVKMTINCIWWSSYGQGGPTLWPEQMKKMAEMNLECTFDISFFGDDGEDYELTKP